MTPDMHDILGQRAAIQQLERALARKERGVVLGGAPGTPKSQIARRIPTVMPPLDDTARRWLFGQHAKVFVARPIREMQYGLCRTALLDIEVQKACYGILFVDNLHEFSEGMIVALGRTLDVIPGERRPFVVATTTLCQCGWFSTNAVCSCNHDQIIQFGIMIGRYASILQLSTYVGLQWYGNRSEGLERSESSEAIRRRIYGT